jgi:hypothetical protein
LEKLDAMAKRDAELIQYLKSQGIFRRWIEELSGRNAAIRAYRKEQEAAMTCCLREIAAQITRKNWIVGDALEFIASQMREGGERDDVQELANAYHMKDLMASEPCEAAK